MEEWFLDSFHSNEFSVMETEGDRYTKWMLEIVPNTAVSLIASGGSNKYLKFLIHNKNSYSITTKIQLSFLDGAREKKETVIHLKKFKPNSSLELCSHSWKSLVDKKLCCVIGNRDMTIVCEMTNISSTSFSDGPKRSNASEAKSLSLLLDKSSKIFSESFSQFHLSTEMSDVQIKCEDQTFDAHQLILSARSPVFRAMFQAEMREKTSSQVVIRDLKAKLIPEMLKYFYTGSCCINDKKPDIEMVSGLLEAADKYQIDVLKEMCETVLSGILILDNALQLYSLGDMHSAQHLKKNALNMIVTNARRIIGTQEWKDCAENRPHVLIVIAEAIASAK